MQFYEILKIVDMNVAGDESNRIIAIVTNSKTKLHPERIRSVNYFLADNSGEIKWSLRRSNYHDRVLMNKTFEQNGWDHKRKDWHE